MPLVSVMLFVLFNFFFANKFIELSSNWCLPIYEKNYLQVTIYLYLYYMYNQVWYYI